MTRSHFFFVCGGHERTKKIKRISRDASRGSTRILCFTLSCTLNASEKKIVTRSRSSARGKINYFFAPSRSNARGKKKGWISRVARGSTRILRFTLSPNQSKWRHFFFIPSRSNAREKRQSPFQEMLEGRHKFSFLRQVQTRQVKRK